MANSAESVGNMIVAEYPANIAISYIAIPALVVSILSCKLQPVLLTVLVVAFRSIALECSALFLGETGTRRLVTQELIST
jgi:hypothetical protein